MPWIVGIDEAGYGPNLGPLVMTSVACRVPAALAGADLWQILGGAVRRADEPDDGRLVVGDSKLVFSPARGLARLEATALALLAPNRPAAVGYLGDCLTSQAPAAHAELTSECWYTGTSALPVAVEAGRFGEAADAFRRASAAAEVTWGPVCPAVVCPRRFNRLLDQWGTKGAILGQALAGLLAGVGSANGDGEPVWLFIDKHGGRNTYAAMLQDALPGGMVVAREEGMGRSTYEVLGLGREVRLTFQPRADAEYFTVALASMVSKYLREVLMGEFNRFWQGHVPGLKPTAGYPVDAQRFFEAIRPTAARLNVPEDDLWRRR